MLVSFGIFCFSFSVVVFLLGPSFSHFSGFPKLPPKWKTPQIETPKSIIDIFVLAMQLLGVASFLSRVK